MNTASVRSMQGPRKTYTQRSAYCDQHPGRKSTMFLGVVEQGWLFHCGYGGHYFLAEPAQDDAP